MKKEIKESVEIAYQDGKRKKLEIFRVVRELTGDKGGQVTLAFIDGYLYAKDSTNDQ